MPRKRSFVILGQSAWPIRNQMKPDPDQGSDPYIIETKWEENGDGAGKSRNIQRNPTSLGKCEVARISMPFHTSLQKCSSGCHAGVMWYACQRTRSIDPGVLDQFGVCVSLPWTNNSSQKLCSTLLTRKSRKPHCSFPSRRARHQPKKTGKTQLKKEQVTNTKEPQATQKHQQHQIKKSKKTLSDHMLGWVLDFLRHVFQTQECICTYVPDPNNHKDWMSRGSWPWHEWLRKNATWWSHIYIYIFNPEYLLENGPLLKTNRVGTP